MKPYVVCHMLMSLDGRIVTTNWQLSHESRAEYEETGAFFNADAWMCGRVTMAAFAKGEAVLADRNYPAVQKIDYKAPGTHASFAIAIDANGKLNWQTNEIGGDHVVAILTEKVSTIWPHCSLAGSPTYSPAVTTLIWRWCWKSSPASCR
jgi:2,5-diamino-6-(ribosylamino)-4(3H)-pyrimidinone 5'-phosphate reductase